ncbi:MAG: hypothetical protein U5K33_06760 [Halofilum sp. (in: g-proteobacteria)]|nr:hypothetical protein [Halofilum sp. (in: g-proteobacteria)]
MLQVREADRDDDMLGQMDHDQLNDRARASSRAAAAWLRPAMAGSPVSCGWIEGPYCEDEVRSLFIPRPEGEAVWDFDVYVAPDQRGTPVFARLLGRGQPAAVRARVPAQLQPHLGVQHFVADSPSASRRRGRRHALVPVHRIRAAEHCP